MLPLLSLECGNHNVSTLIRRETLRVNNNEWGVELHSVLVKHYSDLPLFVEKTTISHRHTSVQHPFNLHLVIESKNYCEVWLDNRRKVVL